MLGTWVATVVQESNGDYTDSSFAVQELWVFDEPTKWRSERHETLLSFSNTSSSTNDEEDGNENQVLWSFY